MTIFQELNPPRLPPVILCLDSSQEEYLEKDVVRNVGRILVVLINRETGFGLVYTHCSYTPAGQDEYTSIR